MQLIISLLIISLFNINENYDENYLIVGNDLMKYDKSIRGFIKTSKLYPKNFELNKNHIIKFKGRNLLSDNRSGILYEITKDSIKRIDKSYDDRIHSRSLNFSYNDSLFKFGGYGYYQANNLLTYFDEDNSEWDLVKYKGHENIDGFSSVRFHFIFNNYLNVIGYDSHKKKYQNETNVINEGFVFDLKDNSFHKKIIPSHEFEYPDNYVQIDDKFIFLF